MVDLLYRFAKRPLGASPLPSKDSGLDLCARCAKLRFLRLHNGELALINALFIPPPLIWTSPRRQRGIQV